MTPSSLDRRALAAGGLVVLVLALVGWLVGGSSQDVSGVRPVEAGDLQEGHRAGSLDAEAPEDHAKDGPRESEEGASRVPVAGDPLEPEVLRLVGTVLGPGGRHEVGAMVALFAAGGGRPLADPRPAVTYMSKGTFSLRLPDWAFDRELILVARSSRCRPATRPLRLDREELPDAITLQLAEGFSIGGRILRHGKPVVGIPLQLDLLGATGVAGAGRVVGWFEGRLEEHSLQSRTNHAGEFRFLGLGPWRHRLSFEASPLRSRDTRSHEFVAPMEGILLDISEAQFLVRVLGPSEALPAAYVEVLSKSGSSTTFVPTREPHSVQVTPLEEVEFVLRHPHARPLRVQRVAPGKGSSEEVDLVLEPVPGELPVLDLHIPRAGIQGIEAVRFHLRDVSTGEKTSWTVGSGPDPDRFVIEALNVEPGRYALEVSVVDQEFFWIEEREVDVPLVGRVEVEMEAVLGGLLALRWRNGIGPVVATYTVMDAAGRVVLRGTDREPMRFQGTIRGLSASGSMGTIEQRLPPGTYRLDVEKEGHAPFSEPVAIEVRTKTVVHVVLQPE